MDRQINRQWEVIPVYQPAHTGHTTKLTRVNNCGMQIFHVCLVNSQNYCLELFKWTVTVLHDHTLRKQF